MEHFPELIPADGSSEAERLKNWVGRLQAIERYAAEETVAVLTNDRTPSGLAKLMAKLTALQDEELANVLKPLERLPEEQRLKMQPQCKVGCAHCCYQDVTVTIAELTALYEYIKVNCDEERIEHYKEASKRYGEERAALQPGEKSKLPCPMLINEMCSAYAARPIVCRGFVSMDVERCRLRRVDTFNKMRVKIPGILPMRRVSRTVSMGLLRGFMAMGFPPNEVNLALALGIAFEEPLAFEKYLAGENVFLSAEVERDQTA